MMMNATEAKAKTNEYLKIDAQAKYEEMKKFITDVIEIAIITASENRSFSCFVEVPEKFNLSKVAEIVRKYGYTCTTQYRSEADYLLISW